MHTALKWPCLTVKNEETFRTELIDICQGHTTKVDMPLVWVILKSISFSQNSDNFCKWRSLDAIQSKVTKGKYNELKITMWRKRLRHQITIKILQFSLVNHFFLFFLFTHMIYSPWVHFLWPCQINIDQLQLVGIRF